MISWPDVRKPLMVVSAADLGVQPTSVESQLMWVFEVAVRWQAVVLIDEADVFLEARSSSRVSMSPSAIAT